MVNTSATSIEFSITTIYYNSEWNKMILLLWKNIRVVLNIKNFFTIFIISPTFFYILPVILRIRGTSITNAPQFDYNTINLTSHWIAINKILDDRKSIMNEKINGFTYSPFVPQKIIGYAPSIKSFKQIMSDSTQQLQPMKIRKYSSCERLKKDILKQSLFCGVCFTSVFSVTARRSSSYDTKVHMLGIYPVHIGIQLMFPNVVRIYNDTFISSEWETHSLQDVEYPNLPRNVGKDDGGYVGYIREGFAYVYNVVAMSYLQKIHLISKSEMQLPEISLQRFPEPAYVRDELLECIHFTISLMLMLSKYYAILHLVSTIVDEKERMSTEYAKVHDVNINIGYLAWFIKMYLVCIPSIIVATVLLKAEWINGLAIFNKTSTIAFLIIISVYEMASIAFVLMVSSLFATKINAVKVTAFLWFASYIPHFASVGIYDDGMDFIEYFFLYILHNSAIGYLLNTLLTYELYAKSTLMHDLLYKHYKEFHLTISAYLLIMLMQSVFYILGAFYLNDIIRKLCNLSKFYKKFPGFWKHTSTTHHTLRSQLYQKESFIHEIDSQRAVLVEMRNVTKMYGEEVVIRDFSMQLLENQITVLLGHNGCGKSTVLRLISGLTKQTSGSIFIEGFNTVKEKKFACGSVGLCLQDSFLYPNLTVEDQIRFFSYLKGFDVISVEKDVEKYLRAMNLTHQRETLTRDLPIGITQELAICCALAGRSRIILIDECNAAMDESSRMRCYELLINEKRNRTILLASNYTDILNALGDRVAIMSNGELQCLGSPAFIKKIYGRGFRLSCIKRPGCKSENVTELIQTIIPQCTPSTDVPYEVSYTLEDKYQDSFQLLMSKLQENLNQLQLVKVFIRPLNFKEIFFKLGTLAPAYENRLRFIESLRGESLKQESTNQFIEIEERVHNWRRTWQHITAIMRIKFKFLKYHKLAIAGYVFIPPMFVVLAFLSTTYYFNQVQRPEIKYHLAEYLNSISVADVRHNMSQDATKYSESYGQSVFWLGYQHNLVDTGKMSFEEYILSKSRYDIVSEGYVVGASFFFNRIECWFNNLYLHSVPLSMNLAHTAIQRAMIGEYSSISLSFMPVNAIDVHSDAHKTVVIGTGSVLGVFIGMIICFLTNGIIYTNVNDSRCGFEDLQKDAGINWSVYWLTTVAVDVLCLLFIQILIIITIIFAQIRTPINAEALGWYSVTILLIGFSILSFNYMLSQFFKEPVNGYIFGITVAALSEICFTQLHEVDYGNRENSLKLYGSNYFAFFPYFALANAICTIHTNMENKRLCNNRIIYETSVYLEQCHSVPNCCYNYNVLNFDTGILWELIAAVMNIVFFWTIITIRQKGYFRKLIKTPRDNYDALLSEYKHRHECTYPNCRNDPAHEYIKLRQIRRRNYSSYALICDRMGKIFDASFSVARFNLVLRKGEIFGLAGASGSGKTTVLKMIAGLISLSYGRTYVNGHNSLYDLQTIRSLVGYGPQITLGFYELTVQDLMEYISLLRNYPKHTVDDICRDLAKTLGFYDCYYKNLNNLSTGTSRLLLCALALLGNPPILVLDSLTPEIDASARLRFWNILDKLRSRGTTLIYASNDYSSFEKHCDRIGVMSDGTCQLITSPRALDALYENYYVIKIKLNSNITDARYDANDKYLYVGTLNKLDKFVTTNFPNAISYQTVGHFIEYLIPVKDFSTWDVLQILKANQYYLHIEHFEMLRYVL